MLMVALVAMLSLDASAQNYKPKDSDIVGVWVMDNFYYEGQNKVQCGAQSGYSQVKYYGADGEYACAQVAKGKDGICHIMPHEYGTYTFKNGVYSEMGRQPTTINFLDRNTSTGQWMTRHDVWKRVENMPKTLVKHIVERCKQAHDPDAKVQTLINDAFFAK